MIRPGEIFDEPMSTWYCRCGLYAWSCPTALVKAVQTLPELRDLETKARQDGHSPLWCRSSGNWDFVSVERKDA